MSYHFTEEFKGWHVNVKAVFHPKDPTPGVHPTTCGT